MKRFTLAALVVAAVLCVVGLSACGASNGTASGNATGDSSDADKVKVVCATFPAYDWVRQVVGDESDHVGITYLMGNGVDLHSYQPSVEDVARIADADLFVYVGGESDQWPADAVKAANNPRLHSLSLLETVGDAAVEEEVVEGMQSNAQDEAGEDEAYDEHVWLSLHNAQTLVAALANELASIDPERAATYEANAQTYASELADLDARFAEAIRDAPHDTLLFADRFPFRYVTRDYDLNYYAAFAGCSAETEASFDTVAFLAQKLDELKLNAVLVLENSDQKMAQTVIKSTAKKDQAVLVVDSLQSTTQEEIDAGKTYIDAMEKNLSVIVEALS